MKLTYEQAMAELQGIVGGLESETIGMDELTEKVKRAAELLEYCKNKLHKTEQEVGRFLDKKN